MFKPSVNHFNLIQDFYLWRFSRFKHFYTSRNDSGQTAWMLFQTRIYVYPMGTWKRYHVITTHRCQYDAITTSCAWWVPVSVTQPKIYYSGGKTMINRMSYWEQMLKHKRFMNYRKMNITRQCRSRSVRSGLQPFRLHLLGALLHCGQTFFFHSFRKIKETAFISDVFFQYLRYFVILEVRRVEVGRLG